MPRSAAPRTPRHREIFAVLQRELAAGAYAGDGLLPGEHELCRRFAVSRPTAARALNDLRALGLIERRPGSGSRVRRGGGTHGHVFGLVGAGLGHTEILGPLGAEIARAAEDHGCRLIQGDAGAAEADAPALCRGFRAAGVAGVFFAPLELSARREAVNRRIADACAAAGIAVVLLDRDLADYPGRSALDLVAIDDVRAGSVLGGHLLARGCRRLGFVLRPGHPSTSDLRMAGCRAAVAAFAGAEFSVHPGDPADPTFALALLRRHRRDALVCANDRTAASLMRTLTAAGVRIPAEVRLAGFDDIAAAAAGPVPLTSMRLPLRELGALAVRTLLERIRDPALPPRQVLATARLVARRSTARG